MAPSNGKWSRCSYSHALRVHACRTPRTWNGQHGGSGGSSHSSFSLAEGDYISKIDGKTNDVIVDQLTFTVTTKTGSTVVHGPYGKTAKKAFSVQGKIVAFFGNSGNLLDGVGVYYHPK